MKKEKASAKLTSLIQKENEDLYIYYYLMEGLLKGIHRQDQVTKSDRDIVTLSLSK